MYYQSPEPVNTGALPVDMQSLCNEINNKINVDYKVKHKEQLLKMYILTSAKSEELL